MSRPAYILRALIRNDEALVEHYTDRLFSGEYEASRTDLVVQRARIVARLNARRDELATLSAALPPASTSRAPIMQPGDNSVPGTYATEPSTAAR